MTNEKAGSVSSMAVVAKTKVPKPRQIGHRYDSDAGREVKKTAYGKRYKIMYRKDFLHPKIEVVKVMKCDGLVHGDIEAVNSSGEMVKIDKSEIYVLDVLD